jgi:hypothetical protein
MITLKHPHTCKKESKMPAIYGHPDTEKYEACDLTIDQWKDVIKKAEGSSQSDLFLYILRSFANQQVVTNGSINAFKGVIVETADDRRNASTAIGNITTWVRSVTGNPKASFYDWNTIQGEWTIGYFQVCSLRMAFGGSRSPSGSHGRD